MSKLLEKYREDRDRLLEKKLQAEKRYENAEKKLQEQEKLEIYEVAEAENITPDQLSRLIAFAKNAMPGVIPAEIFEEVSPEKTVKKERRKSSRKTAVKEEEDKKDEE